MLIKSILVHLTNPFFNSWTVTIFHLEAACSSSCHAFSRVVKGRTALLYNTSTGVTLASRGNSTSEKLQGLVVLSLWDSSRCSPFRVLGDIIAKFSPYTQIPMDAPTRTRFQQFMSDPPLSSFKKLIVSTPRLQCNLHTMSLAKAVPNGLKDCEYKRITFH